MMRTYSCLSNNQTYYNEEITLLPIRDEDKYVIMNWRNEQIYHLRQEKKLTKASQEAYFKDVISPSFIKKNPPQVLFSVLKDQKCIGYGGLVHIDWLNQNAEVSFLIDTQLEKKYFESYWELFLPILTKVAFEELCFQKIYIYSYNLRPLLYKVLEKMNFIEEACLRNHKKIGNHFIDVRIHSKFRA